MPMKIRMLLQKQFHPQPVAKLVARYYHLGRVCVITPVRKTLRRTLSASWVKFSIVLRNSFGPWIWYMYGLEDHYHHENVERWGTIFHVK